MRMRRSILGRLPTGQAVIIPHPGTLCMPEASTPTARRPRTPAPQQNAMEHYVKDFHSRFPDVKIIGHNQVAAKACPSFDVPAWLKSIGIEQ